MANDDRSRFVMPLDQVRIAQPGDPVLDDEKDVDDEDTEAPAEHRFAAPRGPHMKPTGGIVP